VRLQRHLHPPAQSRSLAPGERALRPLSGRLLARSPGERACPSQRRCGAAGSRVCRWRLLMPARERADPSLCRRRSWWPNGVADGGWGFCWYVLFELSRKGAARAPCSRQRPCKTSVCCMLGSMCAVWVPAFVPLVPHSAFKLYGWRRGGYLTQFVAFRSADLNLKVCAS